MALDTGPGWKVTGSMRYPRAYWPVVRALTTFGLVAAVSTANTLNGPPELIEVSTTIVAGVGAPAHVSVICVATGLVATGVATPVPASTGVWR